MNRRLAMALAVLLVCAGGGLTVWWMIASPTDELDADLSPADGLVPAWPESSDGGSTSLEFDAARGPVWPVSANRSVAVTPVPDEADLSWSLTRDSEDIVITGNGSWAGLALRARWHFRQNDPQATVAIRLADVPLSTLRERNFGAAISLPRGQLRAPDGSLGLTGRDGLRSPHSISPWEPGWIQWTDGERRLAVRDWTGDGMTVRPDGDRTELQIDLWRSGAHPLVERCRLEDEQSPPTLDVRASAVVHFGTAPTVFPSRLPAGREAAVAPIFDLPEAHPDSTLHQGSADEPEEWASRARTLAFGHSDPEDPRYGNGGLLGHGLGGTIAVPSEWWDRSPVAAFRDEVRGTDVTLASRGGLPAGDGEVATTIGDSFSCRSVLETDERGLQAAAYGFVPFRDELASAVDSAPGDGAPILSAPTAGLPTGARPLRLDGSRPALTDEALADRPLDALMTTRAVATFATPLVGSRNPLIPAAREALLSPERHGEWTLTSPFTEALTSLEITAEMKPLAVRSLSTLVAYWRDARRVTRRWTGDGDLLIRSASPVDGYTLIVDGTAIERTQISVDGADEVAVRHTSDDAGPDKPRPQTWIWWDLAAGTTYRIDFGEATSQVVEPRAVTWEITE